MEEEIYFYTGDIERQNCWSGYWILKQRRLRLARTEAISKPIGRQSSPVHMLRLRVLRAPPSSMYIGQCIYTVYTVYRLPIHINLQVLVWSSSSHSWNVLRADVSALHLLKAFRREVLVSAISFIFSLH